MLHNFIHIFFHFGQPAVHVYISTLQAIHELSVSILTQIHFIYVLQIPSLISKACDDLHAEMGMLEKNLQEAQARLTEKNHAKEYEVANLKKIVSELELRLKREQDRNISVLEEMRTDMHTKAEKLKEQNLHCAELRRHLDQAKQEVRSFYFCSLPQAPY